MPSSSSGSEDTSVVIEVSDSDTSLSTSASSVTALPSAPLLQGSETQALWVNTLFFFMAFTAVFAVGPVVATMTLSPFLKGLLAGAPAIVGSFTQIPQAIQVDKNGGKQLALILRTVALLGTLGICILSAVTDLSAIDSVDWRYVTMLLCNALVGVAFSAFPLGGNALLWSPEASLGKTVAVFGGVGGFAPALGLIYFELTAGAIGFTETFGVFSALSFIAIFLGAKFIEAPPYHQYIRAGRTESEAEALCEAKTRRFPKIPERGYARELMRLVKDSRYLTLFLGGLTTGGGNIAAGLSMFLTLTELLGLSTREAVVITAAGTAWTALVRTATGKPLDWFDKSKGVYTFLIGGGLVTVGSFMLAAGASQHGLPYTLCAKFIMDTGFGIGVVGIQRLVLTWAQPLNTRFYHWSPAMVNGAFSTSGPAGGALFPIAVGLFGSQGKSGFQDSFYLPGIMAAGAMVAVGVTHLRVNNPLPACPQFFKREPVQDARVVELDTPPSDDAPPAEFSGGF